MGSLLMLPYIQQKNDKTALKPVYLVSSRLRGGIPSPEALGLGTVHIQFIVPGPRDIPEFDDVGSGLRIHGSHEIPNAAEWHFQALNEGVPLIFSVCRGVSACYL